MPAQPLPNKWLTLIAVCLGLGMLMIDTFVVNVAFPSIGRDLNASLSATEWTVSGYVLVLGVLPLAMGRLGDILGRKKVYIAGLVLFTIASAGCGAAQSIEQLIALRILQGVGAAITMPLTLSILIQAFPPAQRGLAVGLWGGVSGLGLIAGPILGGLLVNGDSWRLIFLVNIPVGAIALAMAFRYITESGDPNAPRRIDWPGMALLAGGLAIVMYALTEANDRGWTDPLIVTLFVAGPLALAAFWVLELRLKAPLVDVRLFRNGTFTFGCVAAFLFSAAVFGSQPYTSLFMQNYLGLSPLQGGLAFLPATALVAILMPFSGIIGQRLGNRLRVLIVAGSLFVGASFIYLLWLTTEQGYSDGLLAPFIMRGLGIGLFMSASSLAVMSAIPVTRSGLASGTLTMFRQTGTAFGVALFGAVFIHHVETSLPERLGNSSDAARTTAAAEHFVVAGSAEDQAAASQVIVDGFVVIAQVGVGLAAVAAISAFFIRKAIPVGQPQTQAAPTVPSPAPSPGGSS